MDYILPDHIVRSARCHAGDGDSHLFIEGGSAEARAFFGAFDHIYASNRFGQDGYGTHYVVLAFEQRLDGRADLKLDDYHADSKWMSETELMTAVSVHPLVKAYFKG